MPEAWRLTKTKYLSSAWNGEGAKKAGGRWNSLGVPVVYVSASLSLALVEVLVHLPAEILGAYSAVPVEIDDALMTALPPARLPPEWKDNPPPPAARAIGDRWVASGASVALRVPSVVVPGEFNFILNPAHRDFGRIRIGAPMSFPFDPRLARGGRAVSGESG